MAQIGVQQPTNLQDMFSSPSPMLWDIASNQVNQQSQSNAINQNSAIQDQQIAQQKLPFELNQMDLNNQMTGAQIPGQQALSSMNQDKANISRQTLPNQMQAQISDLASKITKNHLDEAESAVKAALVDPSAEVRATANDMWNNLSAIKAEKMKQDSETQRAMSMVGAQGANQQALMQQQIDAGRFNNKSWNVGLSTRIQNESDPIKLDALLRKGIEMSQLDQEPQGVEKYTQLLQANKPAYDNAMAAKTAANAGKVNAVDLTGMPAINPPTAQIPGQPEADPAGLKTNSYAAPKTQSEYDKLPSGTIYIDTDGKTKRKK